MTPTPAEPLDMAQLREWAELHARHGSRPWQLVCNLFAEHDRRGEIIGDLAARVAGQFELLSRKAESLPARAKPADPDLAAAVERVRACRDTHPSLVYAAFEDAGVQSRADRSAIIAAYLAEHEPASLPARAEPTPQPNPWDIG